MFLYPKVEFVFPIELSSKTEEKEKFILEGFAAANDFDFQNDIISDLALRRATKGFREKGRVCLNHTKRVVGKILDCHFTKGKLWVKLEITEPEIVKKIKTGELNSLSVKGQVDYRKVERVTPFNKIIFRIIKDANFEEVSLVPQGANPEAKAIRWYIQKAIDMAEKIMDKNLKEDFENLEEEKELETGEETEKEETEGEETEEIGEEEEETEKEEEKADLGCGCGGETPPKGTEKKEEEGKESEEEKEELAENIYVEKSAYTKCMGAELKKGTPFKEAAKICSKKTKEEGKVLKVDKSAYTECMKREMGAGKTMAEAAKTCKEEEGGETEKSAYTQCMKREMKAGKSMAEAAKVCKETAGEETEKSAYSQCMRREMKAGKSMAEAAKTCKEEVEKARKYPYPYKYPYPSKYPYGYPYPYPYRYPRRVKKAGEAEQIAEMIDKIIGETTDKKIVPDLRKIKSLAGKLGTPSAYPYPEIKNLSENERVVYEVINSADIELGEGATFQKELLRIGEWFHGASKDGMLKVTRETLEKIIKNFKEKVLDNVMVPLGHPTSDDPSKNVGEISDLALSQDGEKLMATLDVKDETVVEKIKKKLIKGISASIAEDYVRKDTGQNVGPTLFHAALVSEPYIKGMAGFVPLSEEFEGSLVIPILNMEAPLTLEEMSSKIEKIEKQLKLEISEKETSEEETLGEKKPESSEVGEEAEKEEKEETKPEKTETEETKPETGEAEEGVALADAEKMFGELLEKGHVTPAEKELLLPLLASNAPIELSEGRKVDSGKALYEYLRKQSPKFSLSEEGMAEGEKVKKEEEIPEEIDRELSKMDFNDPEEKKAIYKEFKEKKEKSESTPF